MRDWTLTGAPNPLDITGGRRTVVFASKMPDHRGIVLNGDVQIDRPRIQVGSKPGDLINRRSDSDAIDGGA